jgi:hypothetical protein
VTRLCAVSIDLDEVELYRALHGLAHRSDDAVYAIALDRAAAFADSERLPLTLFAVGGDLEREANAERLASLSRAGHRIESHSYGHQYDLSRLSPSEIDDDVRRAQERIEAVTGRRPLGFRAPGYAVSDALFDALERHGLSFDSSVLPSFPYYLAKAGALAWMAARGRKSVAVLDTPRVMAAPAQPYRAGRPWYRRGERALLELPIGVTPLARLPFIGTALTLGGARGARLLARTCVGMELVNLELHGIDFLDARDGLADLVGFQPDVRVPVEHKLRAIGAALDVLRSAGYDFVTLAEAADSFTRRLATEFG